MEIISVVLVIVYVVASWWAFRVLFEGSVMFGTIDNIIFMKWFVPLVFGVFLIPAALIKRLFQKISR